MDDEYPGLANVVHFTTLIDAHVRRGNTVKAFEMFQNLRTWRALEPDEVLFTVMIKACGVNREAERALNILDDLRACGLYPTDITYRELIKVMAQRADFAKKAFEFKNHMDAEDLPMCAEVYGDLLLACSKLENSKGRASAVLAEMQTKDLVLTPDGYENLVRCFARAMFVEVPQERKNGNGAGGSFQSSLRHGSEPSRGIILNQVYNSDTSVEHLVHSTSDNCQHSSAKRPVALKERVLNLRQAWMVVQDAKRKKVEISRGMLDAIMSVYIEGTFDGYAVEMLHQYADFGVQPGFQTYRSLLEMFHLKKDVARFFSLWDVANDQGVFQRYLRESCGMHGLTGCVDQYQQSWPSDSTSLSRPELEGEGPDARTSNREVEKPAYTRAGFFAGASSSDFGNTTDTSTPSNIQVVNATLSRLGEPRQSGSSGEGSDLHNFDLDSLVEMKCTSIYVPEYAREQVSNLHQLALDNSIRSQSSRRCCNVLEQLYEVGVFPCTQMSERLAKVGRHVLDIHQWVQKFITMNRQTTYQRVTRDQTVLDAELREYGIRQALEGRRTGQRTAAEKARKDNFKTLRRRGDLAKPRFQKGEYMKRKAKGGEYWSQKVDRQGHVPELPS
ncbi:unnamed protein product [Amoebophrya sp. A25]|nr:unnamed protein product [Amoebophrya sp. A25]|eukprot:GSA25T00005919001.1